MGFFNRISNQKRCTSLEPAASGSAHTQSVVRTVIVLGGGGARGAAHIGVMRRIRESDLEISRIVGVSMGAFVGAMCAVSNDMQSIEGRTDCINSIAIVSVEAKASRMY
jgi:NTE family protein